MTSSPHPESESEPTSPLLKALLARLVAADQAGNHSFGLSPEIVQATAVTDLFGSLLGQTSNTLPVTGAVLSSTATSVNLSAVASYPFAAARPSTFTFLDVAGKLELQLAVPDLGSFAIADLIAKKIVPASVYNPATWGANLSPLQLGMKLDSKAAALSFGGSPTTAPWTIGVGLVGVGIGQVTPALEILAPEGSVPKRYVPEVTSSLSLSSGTQIPVLVSIPSGLDGWIITLGDSSGVMIGDLSTFNPLMGGANSALPTDLIAIGGFRLTQLRFAFAPTAPDLWRIRALFDVTPTGSTPWSILGGLVKFTGVSAGVDVTLFSGSGIEATGAGFLRGTMVVNDSLKIDVGMAGPDIQGLWRLGGQLQLANFDLGALAAYMGGSAAPVESTLSRIGTQGFALTAIAMRLALSGSTPGLRRLSLDLGVANWTVPGLSWFVIQEISVSLDIENPTQASRVITGKVQGILTLGNVQVAVTVDFSQADKWHLQLAAFAAELSGLDQINIKDLIPAADIGTFLPSGLPINTTFGLGGFSMSYDTARSFVTDCSFDLEVNADWSWASDALSLQQIEVHLQATRASAGANAVITGSIAGTVGLGGAIFELTAEKRTASDPWSFRGGLAEAYTVDFAAVLKQIDPALELPSAFLLPKSVTVLVADLMVTPATGALDFSSQGTVSWSYTFGSTPVSITAIGGQLRLPGGGGKATGALSGDFSIGKLQGLASIAVGDGKVSDTIITVQVATGAAASTATLVDAVIGAGTYEGVSVPIAFPQPAGFTKAAAVLNLTQSTLLLTGETSTGADSMYGAAALLVGKDGNAQWGFVLAVALQKWTLAQLSPALAGVDSIIGLTSANAAIALSLLNEKAGSQVAAAVPAIGADMSIAPGLNFFCRLDFSGGWLTNVSQIIAIQGPYTISGNVPAGVTKPVTLRSTLGSLRLLDTFAFNGIVLVYVRTPGVGIAPASNDLRLSGEIVATLDQPYTFKGDLNVTSGGANFAVTTAHSVPNPLGIPGLTLDQLGFALSCDFVGGKTTNVVVSFIGKVSFTSGPTLLGHVALQKGTPTLVLIELTTPDKKPAVLSISALFNQATGLTWPDAADVSLSKGQLWYVPGDTPVTYQGTTYQPGFHAGVQANIFFLPAVKLDLAIYDGRSVGQPKGLTATAQFVAPVDWSFIVFAGTQAHGGSSAGPFFSIDTRKSQLPCTLGAGISLFGTSVGDVTISAGRQKMSGTFTLPSSAGIFAGSSLSFTWDSNGFRVTDWPLQGPKLPAFVLENIKGGGVCSQVILDLLPIDSKFDLDVSLSILPPANGNPATLGLTLSGYFDLVVTSRAYASDPLLRAKIASATISIPFPGSGGYDWGMLQNNLVQAIKDAGESIIQNLLLDPKNVAKLAAVAGAKWAISEAVDYLVCRGMTLEAAEGAVGLAASAEVSMDVVVCAGATVAVGGVVGIIVGGVFINGPPPNPSKPRPQKPGRPTLQFNGTALSIAWAATDPGNTTSYAIALADTSGKAVPLSAVTTSNTTVPVSLLTLGKVYTAQIIGSGPGGQSDPSDPATLALLPTPAAPTLSFDDPLLSANWAGVGGATGYQLTVLDAKGAPVTNPVITFGGTPTAVRATVQAAAFEGGGSFTVQVAATVTGGTGPAGRPASVMIAVLPAPLGIAAYTSGASLHVSWQLVPNATVYHGVVTDAKGGKSTFTTLATQGLSADVNGPSIVDGAVLKVTVQAGASGAVGIVSTPLPVTIDILPVPAIASYGYTVAGRQLLVGWTPIARATSGYALQLSDANDNPVTPASVTFSGASAVVAMGTLAAGTYNVRVRAMAPDAHGAWSPALKVAIIDLAVPGGVRVILDSARLLVRWTMVPNAVSYLVQILDASHAPLVPQPSIKYDALGATVDGSKFVRGNQYYVVVQPLAPNVVGPPCIPVAYTWQIVTPWYTDGHDFQRTSRSSYAGPAGSHERWSVDLSNGLLNFSAAIAADGSVLLPAFHWLISFEANGSERWRWAGPSAFIGPPTIGPDGAIYIEAEGDSISCLEANGKLRWQFKGSVTGLDAPLLAGDGTVYACGQGSVYAINPDGSLKWTFGSSDIGGFYGMALGIDGTVYAGHYNGCLHAITPAGALAWKYTTGGPLIPAATVGSDGSIYIGSSDGAFYALKADGTLKWRNSLTSASAFQYFSGASLAADGTVYVHLGDDSLYAFNPDGSSKWRTVLGSANGALLQSRPAIDAAGTIYVGSENGKLFAIAPDGSISWTKLLGAPFSSSMRSNATIATDGTLYFGALDSLVRAVGPGTISGVTQVASVPSAEPYYSGYALGDYAIVAKSESGLVAYDVTTPSKPKEIQHVAERGNYRVLAQRSYDGYFLYASATTNTRAGGLRIYDMSALPAALPKIGEAAGPALTGGPPRGIAVAFGFAFVACDEDGLLVFSVSDPTQPKLLSTIPAARNDAAAAVAQRGDWVYVGWSMSGLQIYAFPMRNAAPVRLGGFGTWSDVGYIATIALYGQYAVVGSVPEAFAGISVIDVSDPTKPRLVTKYAVAGGVQSIEMRGSFAILAGNGYSAIVLDMSDPAHPTRVASLDTPTLGGQLSLVGPYAFLASKGLQILELQTGGSVAIPSAP